MIDVRPKEDCCGCSVCLVFGARFDENWNVFHSYADAEEGVMDFIGSNIVNTEIIIQHQSHGKGGCAFGSSTEQAVVLMTSPNYFSVFHPSIA